MRATMFGFGLMLVILFVVFGFGYPSEDNSKRSTTRCHPAVYIADHTDHVKPAVKKEKNSEEMHIHDDTNRVANKGFVNELMYKPDAKNGNTIKYQSKLVEDEYKTVGLNHKKHSYDLPIANIDVNYLMDTDRTRLRI